MSPFSLIDASRLHARGSSVADHDAKAIETRAMLLGAPGEGKRKGNRLAPGGAIFAGILMSFGVRASTQAEFGDQD